MISKKHILLAAGILFAGTLAGCNTIGGEEKNPPVSANLSSEISEEAFAKAMDDYLAKNQIAFGEKVVASANAFQKEQAKNKSAEKEAKMKAVPPVSATDHVKGSSAPEFILYEYSDYHCPYCQKFHPISAEFVKNNPNVQLVFRALPFKGTDIHEVAECVAKVSGNDAFWKFNDIAFSDASLSLENYETVLAKYNIPGIDAIKACKQSGEMKKFLEKAIDDGLAMGIEGTPNNILQNVKTGEIRLFEGAYPLSELEKAMAELKK